MSLRRAVSATIAGLLALGSMPAAMAATSTGQKAANAVDAVYAHAERSLRAIGVYHLTTDIRSVIGADSGHSTRQDWIDVSLGAARGVQKVLSGSSRFGRKGDKSVDLLADGIQWYDGRPTTPGGCHHTGAAVAFVLGCPNPVEVATSKVVNGRWKGRPVLVLVTHAVGYGEDETQRTTTLTYLDPKSALPLESDESGTEQSGTVQPLHITRTFRSEKLRLASLPATFFSAASLGWKVPDPTKGLPHGLPVYWLGRTWSPGGHLPDLVLQGVDRLNSPTPMYQEILEYALASDRFGPRVLSIQIWTAKAWAAGKVQFGIPLCKPVSHVTLPLARVTWYCSDQPHGVTGDLSPPGAHLLVDAPGYGSPTLGSVNSPYDSIAALETVINALQVRA